MKTDTISLAAMVDRLAHECVFAYVAPDVIVGNSTPVIAAMKQATSSIPIVFASVNDPVG